MKNGLPTTKTPLDSLFTEELPARRSALIVGPYRYRLERVWGPEPHAVWIGCNPSIADAEQEDPTLRRIIGFSKREGCGGIVLVNLFGLISTDPAALLTHDDPVGPANLAIVEEALQRPGVGLIVCAWGSHPATQRVRGSMRGLIRRVIAGRVVTPVPVRCLGTNGDGNPKHPLYLPASAPLVDFSLGREPKREPKVETLTDKIDRAEALNQ